MSKGMMGTAIRQLDLLLHAGSTVGLTDEQLLARFIAREHGLSALAFEALVRRHGPMVLATCRGVLRNEHDAEDAFQATFFILARRADSLRHGDRLGPWLHRVALRAAEVVRGAAARRRVCETAADFAEVAGGDAGPDRALERAEIQRAVHQEVDRLPERYRLVVLLCDLQGESYEAAATRLRVPIGTVRSRLFRARERLRGRFDRRGLALPLGAAAALASETASAAVPLPLLTLTVNLGMLETSGVGAASASASAAAIGHARTLLRANALAGLAKAAAIGAVGLGLTGLGAGIMALKTSVVAPPVGSASGVIEATSRSGIRSDPHPDDFALLQGTWVIDEASQFGGPQRLMIGDRLVIEGDRYLWSAARGEPERLFGRGTTVGTFVLEQATEPRRIDLMAPMRQRSDLRRESTRAIPAIYRLDPVRDRLRLCLGDPDGPGRPREFASDPSSRQLMLAFRREGKSQSGGTGGRQAQPAVQDSDVNGEFPR